MNLTELNLERNWKQAAVFYIASLLLAMILGALSGVLFAAVSGGDSFRSGMRAGQVVGILFTLVLYFEIYRRKQIKSFQYIILGITAGFIAAALGNIASLIIVAFLTTREDLSAPKALIAEESSPR